MDVNSRLLAYLEVVSELVMAVSHHLWEMMNENTAPKDNLNGCGSKNHVLLQIKKPGTETRRNKKERWCNC